MRTGERGRIKPDSGLNLREKPNGEKIGVLRHNDEVEILEEVLFFRVKSESGQVGYVHASYVEHMPVIEKVDVVKISPNLVPSEVFNLVTFSNERLIGDAVKVDLDFVPAMNRICTYAKKFKLKIWATSSTRTLDNQVRGAIVPPASHSCHHIGHAIDMNIQFDGELYNSKKLKRANLDNLPVAIRNFINAIRNDQGLRWGGDFKTEDPVHIDDDFYRKQQIIYLAKLDSRVNQLNT
ncbi:MAG: hypothetical protein ACI88A_000504 [Paraglaciecola sp.]|jgi:hypothetical protein